MRIASVLTVLVALGGAPAARAADDTEGALLRALGGSVAAYLFEAHQKVGVLNDAKAKKVYDKDTLDKEIGVTINILKVVDKQMADLLEAGIPASEKKTVKTVKAIIGKQIKAAEGLKAYWDSKDPDDLEKYTTNREAAWEELRKLMGIDKNPGGIKP